MMPVVRVLAKLRGLRGTAFDVFGRTAERKMERQLIRDYENVVEEVLANLAPGTYATAVELAAIPEHIRGYGHVKDRHLKVAKEREAKLLERLRQGPSATFRDIPITVTA
jgi:indolepyruvate ferredoxin oxidoreductase